MTPCRGNDLIAHTVSQRDPRDAVHRALHKAGPARCDKLETFAHRLFYEKFKDTRGVLFPPSLPPLPFFPSSLPTFLPFPSHSSPVPFSHNLTFNDAQIDFNDSSLYSPNIMTQSVCNITHWNSSMCSPAANTSFKGHFYWKVIRTVTRTHTHTADQLLYLDHMVFSKYDQVL